MEINRPELGNRLAWDSLNCTMTYRFETGWRLRISGRKSGSSEWHHFHALEDQAVTEVMRNVLGAELDCRGELDQTYLEPF